MAFCAVGSGPGIWPPLPREKKSNFNCSLSFNLLGHNEFSRLYTGKTFSGAVIVRTIGRCDCERIIAKIYSFGQSCVLQVGSDVTVIRYLAS